MALSSLGIKAAQPQSRQYRLNDGNSLYVVVYPSGSKSYEYRFRRKGKLRAIVLGDCTKLSLKQARLKRDRLRTQLADGLDPLAQRRIAAEVEKSQLSAAKAAARLRNAEAKRQVLTLNSVANDWVADHRAHWTRKHTHQVEQSLQDHVFPQIGGKPIASIDSGQILDLLNKLLFENKIETARRVRQRLDAVFEYGGLKHNLLVNPVAVAKRHINTLLKLANKANPPSNFPCVPVAELSQLVNAMRSYVGTLTTRSLLWFVALTACRTGEARFAVWSEFNLLDALWTIPPDRMKARREQVVPLAPDVVALLSDLKKNSDGGPFVFSHPRRNDRPASENAILFALSAIGYKDRMTGHGFRQLFSTISNESGLWRADVIEAALAHTQGDEVRAAYNKASYFEARRQLMHWWSGQLACLEHGPSAEVSNSVELS